MKTLISYIIIFVFPITVALAQDSQKWSDYWEKPTPKIHLHDHSQHAPGLFKSSALVWIRIYQKSISSQDLPSCVFHPSCSRFAFGAIEEFGTFRGILLAGDRLMRCNPFAPKYYQFDGEKFSDPISNYRLK